MAIWSRRAASEADCRIDLLQIAVLRLPIPFHVCAAGVLAVAQVSARRVALE